VFKCEKCGFEFDEPAVFIDGHGLDSPPYEVWNLCPSCKSEWITTICLEQEEDEE
jgi:predicted Zn-ribbon and HTH transcriptional regulator